MAVGKGVTQEFVKLNLDQFTKELKTSCTWLKLLVVEAFCPSRPLRQKKRTIWNQTFLKSESVEKSKKKKHPLALSSLRCSYSAAGL